MNWNKLVRELESATAAANPNRWYDGPDEPAAYQAAKLELERAREAIRTALGAATWGQSGSVFVTDRSSDCWGDDRRVRSLSINGRTRVVLTYHGCYRDDKGWVELISADEAEKKFREAKASRQTHEAWYQQERELLVVAVVGARHAKLESFAGYTYRSGQKGGTFCRHGSNISVGAEGTLRSAFGEEWWSASFSVDQAEVEAERRFYGARY